MNNLTINERLLQIVVGGILAFVLLLIILIGIRNKIISKRRGHPSTDNDNLGLSECPEAKAKTEKRYKRKTSLPSYEDCVIEKSNCPDYATINS